MFSSKQIQLFRIHIPNSLLKVDILHIGIGAYKPKKKKNKTVWLYNPKLEAESKRSSEDLLKI